MTRYCETLTTQKEWQKKHSKTLDEYYPQHLVKSTPQVHLSQTASEEESCLEKSERCRHL